MNHALTGHKYVVSLLEGVLEGDILSSSSSRYAFLHSSRLGT
jgi:hypothetical protein